MGERGQGEEFELGEGQGEEGRGVGGGDAEVGHDLRRGGR